MQIRQAIGADFEQIWPVFKEIVRPGDTYTFDADISKAGAERLWMQQPLRTYVCLEEGEVIGTYYLKANQAGGGAHVCNCGYMVPAIARGKGVATAMCEHSQTAALSLGFTAMQFNFVVESNTGAIRLWQQLGFEIVGRLPSAFKHPEQGFIDALVMYKQLDGD